VHIQGVRVAAATGRASLWNEALAGLEYHNLRRDPVLGGDGVADGAGRPVMLIPGYLAPDACMRTMVGWLRATGHHAAHARIGINLRCGERTVTSLEARLTEVARRTGQRVVVIGHSRGGQFARVLAVRHPEVVGGVITLGTPPLDVALVHPLIRWHLRGMTMLSGLGLPAVFGASCLTGSCCAEFRADLEAAIPRRIPFLAVVGERDGCADRGACAPPRARVEEVAASHSGLIVNPGAYRSIARFLAAHPAVDLVPRRRGRSAAPVPARARQHRAAA
jgi:triacylglycerol lipase